jgi:hypothetical protein
MNETASVISIRRREDGVIDHGVPVSTLEPLSAERGRLAVPLQTTMMSCYERTALSQFFSEPGFRSPGMERAPRRPPKLPHRPYLHP